MFEVTRITMCSRASLPHDKIYGVVGLVDLHPREEGFSIVLNYKLFVVYDTQQTPGHSS